jgi:hypothetical protein
MIPGVLSKSPDRRCGVLAGHRREAEEFDVTPWAVGDWPLPYWVLQWIG